jgi:hypothetical protein
MSGTHRVKVPGLRICDHTCIAMARIVMPRNYRKQRLLRVPIYPNTQAETDLERVRGMHPAVPTAKITQRALELGLGRLARLEEDLQPTAGEAAE